jgi:hypothetical protein
VIIDWNNHTADCKDINDVIDVYPLIINEDIVQIIADGHKWGDADGILCALDYYNTIVFRTVKGKGVKVWEKSHSHLQYGKELEEGIKEWRKNEGMQKTS